jgi:HSP20 family protein
MPAVDLGRGRRVMPEMEVKEASDAFILKADVPGLKEQDIDVSIVGNMLTISGKREQEKTEDDKRYYAYERSYGEFVRSFTV